MYRSGKMVVVTLVDGREIAINPRQVLTVEKSFNPAFDCDCAIVEFGSMMLTVRANFLHLTEIMGKAE